MKIRTYRRTKALATKYAARLQKAGAKKVTIGPKKRGKGYPIYSELEEGTR